MHARPAVIRPGGAAASGVRRRRHRECRRRRRVRRRSLPVAKQPDDCTGPGGVVASAVPVARRLPVPLE